MHTALPVPRAKARLLAMVHWTTWLALVTGRILTEKTVAATAAAVMLMKIAILLV
jgi:hypothetical protein